MLGIEANVNPDGSFYGPEDKEFVNIFEKYGYQTVFDNTRASLRRVTGTWPSVKFLFYKVLNTLEAELKDF